MATVKISNNSVEIALTRFEKVAGLLRDLRVPRSAVTSATAVDNGLRALRGLRAPGLGMPGVKAIGTWRGRGYRDFVSTGRGPAVVLELAGQKFARVVVAADNAKDIAAALS